MKKLTYILAVVWISLISINSSIMIGALVHELMHKENAIDPHYITIDYDGGGNMNARAFIGDNHTEIYTKEGLIVATILLVTAISLIIVVRY